MGWIGVDLDRTLAVYHGGGGGNTHIGEPVPLMLARVKHWLIEEAKEVRIFTARASRSGLNLDGTPYDPAPVIEAIENWCLKHIGEKLRVTCEKDFECEAIYDDIAFGVVANTGIIVGPMTDSQTLAAWQARRRTV